MVSSEVGDCRARLYTIFTITTQSNRKPANDNCKGPLSTLLGEVPAYLGPERGCLRHSNGILAENLPKRPKGASTRNSQCFSEKWSGGR